MRRLLRLIIATGLVLCLVGATHAQDPTPGPTASIRRVPTAVPAFVGFTAKAGKKLVNRPIRIGSIRDYERAFGGAEVLPLEVDVDESGGAIAVAVDADPTPPHFLYYSMRSYFANGGGPCYVVSVGDYGTSFSPKRFVEAFRALEREDDITLLAFPEAVLGSASQAGEIAAAALTQAYKLGDRFAIVDVWNAEPGGLDDINKVNSSFRSSLTNDASLRSFGAAYYPYVNTSFPIAYDERRVIVRSHVTAGKPIPAGTPIRDRAVEREWPDIYKRIIEELGKTFVRIPPSGAVAGAFVKMDNSRGVWKALANVRLNGVEGASVGVDASFGEALNVDASSGKSINPIRDMGGKGTLILGARTLDGSSNEFRYESVRRLAITVHESIQEGIAWAGTRPNNAQTWADTKSSVNDFLDHLFKDGAFAGRSAKESYYVRVGLGETMTASDVSKRRMIIEVGFAPLKPAEFVVLRIEQTTGS